MGWAGGAEVMDTMIEAAYSAAAAVMHATEVDSENIDYAVIDEALRPFVASVADQLRDRGWDTIEESDFFDVFAQEMLGHSDGEHEAWLLEQVDDAGDGVEAAEWRADLTAFRKRKGLSDDTAAGP